MILKPIEQDNNIVGYAFQCPACKDIHVVHVKPHKAPNGASWHFNQDLDKPTFRPSVLTKYEVGDSDKICHLYVTRGTLNYLWDCTHELAGKQIEMVDYETEK